MRMLAIAGLVTSTVLSSACATQSHDDPGDSAVTDDTIFFEVAVKLGPDGVVIGEPHPITAAEERADNQARRDAALAPPGSIAIMRDTTCAYPSLWLYDQPGIVGNRVCFSGSGGLDLATIPRGRWFDWEISRGSLWPGVSAGWIWTAESTDAGLAITFPAWGDPQDFDITPQHTRWLNLN